ncbi:transcriptional regulator with XRE-family HTH domain [Alkalibacillus flavidus]|uniref:Transcriptional regulator with XRE-family HTH domain n=1 Tax=Alkalibacillus flavidus TaxID=546021 RepID=A0ABV2L049_9BACI
MSIIGQALKSYRMEQGFTQEQLADGICSVAYLSKLENGKISVDQTVVMNLCDRLELDQTPFLIKTDTVFHDELLQWLSDIHIFHILEVDKRTPSIFETKRDAMSIDNQCLYDIALLGYYLMTDQLQNAATQCDELEKRPLLYQACDPFSFFKFTGMYYRRKGLYHNAIERLEQANDSYHEQEDAELYITMATVYSRLNNILISNKYAQLAFSIFQEKLFYVRMIDCQIVLGVNYSLVGDVYSAETYFQQLLEVDGEHLLDKTRANIHHNIGYINFRKKEYHDAKQSFERALTFNVNESDFLNARYLLAYIAMQERDRFKAKEHIQTGLIVANRYEHLRYKIKFRVLDYLLDEQTDKLVDYLEDEVLSFFETNREEIELKSYYYLLGQLMFDQKKYKRAAECFKRSTDGLVV